MSRPTQTPLEALIGHIRTTRGFDLGNYKRASLERRITKRMRQLDLDDYSLYLDRLQVDSSEYEHLFNILLINVTSFFRDPEIWAYLSAEVVPQVLKSREPTDPIRVWCAGCASGEEAYTMVMVLCEALGRKSVLERVKVYATDIDEAALAFARQGAYSPQQVQSVPPELLDRYFEKSESGFSFDRGLRRIVIFGRHDLLRDAPISHVDFLTSRNTLMYFNSEAQARVVSRFYFGLQPDGVLLLGKAEMMTGFAKAFVPIDLRKRVFTRSHEHGAGDRLMLLAQSGDHNALGKLTNPVRAREMVFESASVAQVMVERSGRLVLANARARELFGIRTADLGKEFRDLELSHRPAQLQPFIDQAQREGRRLSLSEIPWRSGGEDMHLDVHIVPLHENGSEVVGVSLHFPDVSHEKVLRDELETAKHELETAVEELQSTNEELETTNEELQSTNEELETTNEELQATNEELETMNEELQSTNDELGAANDELRTRTSELKRLNVFLEALMSSVAASIILVDSDLRVQLWNERSFELWGLHRGEVEGAPLLKLDIGLPLEKLTPALTACLSGRSSREEFLVAAVNRRGKPITCRVTIAPLETDPAAGNLIILIEQVDSGQTPQANPPEREIELPKPSI